MVGFKLYFLLVLGLVEARYQYNGSRENLIVEETTTDEPGTDTDGPSSTDEQTTFTTPTPTTSTALENNGCK